MNNLGAARKWAKEHTQPQKEQRRAARFANLKRGLIYPWSYITLALSLISSGTPEKHWLKNHDNDPAWALNDSGNVRRICDSVSNIWEL